MELNPRDDDPLHVPINARLTESVAAATFRIARPSTERPFPGHGFDRGVDELVTGGLRCYCRARTSRD